MSEAPPSEEALAAFAAFAARLCEAARRETLPRFRALKSVDNKASGAGFDPVTDGDRAAEAKLRTLIEAAYPNHGIKGEELEDRPADGPYAWTLDPIDGTRAFVCGVPLWTTLIALTYEARPVLGVIDQPYLGERYIGYAGRAVYERGSVRRPLSVRACARLTEATLSTTDPALFAPAEAAAYEQLRTGARLSVCGGDAYGYAMLAAGHVDLVAEAGLAPHDVHALIPVIEGAGGVITDWRGGPAFEGGQVVAAGDARVHADALVALKRAAR